MLNFTNITGKKEVKGYTEEVIIAGPTPGSFKISPLAAKKLKIEDGSFMAFVVLPSEEGKDKVYVAKGIDGVKKLDENGNVMKDDRNREIYEENTASGAIVRPASLGSPLLTVTAAMAWQAVEGSTDKNKFFNLGEGVEGRTSAGYKNENGDEVFIEGTFYPLEFEREENKATRKVKTTVTDAEGKQTEVETEVDEDFTEEEI